MEVTVIRNGYSVEQVLIGKPTEEIKKWVEELNNNPLVSEKWSYKEEYVDKSIYELTRFLGIE